MSAYTECRPGDNDIEDNDMMSPGTPAPFEVDDEFNLPVSIALIILIVYMFFGSFIFVYTDDWSLFESFYFIFI